jgi:UDP-N-acetylglucosamine 2-epimerase
VRILTVIGARPQFIKAASLSRALAAVGLEECLVHTGQHYDAGMSEVFFRELEIPVPKYNLGLGGGPQGAMTGRMLEGLEGIMMDERPDWILVYGDTNTTLAGALAASKLHRRICHVEAGLRSYNRRMPEEINRVLTDHLADLRCCSSEVGVRNLAREGLTDGVRVVGDLMADASGLARRAIEGREGEFLSKIPATLREGQFAVLTLHRAENTDDPIRLAEFVAQLNSLEMPIVFPVHPRTGAALQRDRLRLGPHVLQVAPLSYLEMAALLTRATVVLTDSGGLQKEAYWAKVPCVTLRTETEWVETVDRGWNVVLGEDPSALAQRVATISPPDRWEPLYGDGHAAESIVEALRDS